jgi:hypothetical protein
MPDGTLRYKAPKGRLTPARLDAMREHKTERHGLVEAVEERAGIMEYEAGLPRAEAEVCAWASILGQEIHRGCGKRSQGESGGKSHQDGE